MHGQHGQHGVLTQRRGCIAVLLCSLYMVSTVNMVFQLNGGAIFDYPSFVLSTLPHPRSQNTVQTMLTLQGCLHIDIIYS